MWKKLNLPHLPECNFRHTTLAAIAAGLGAAAGMDYLPWYIFIILPFLLLFLKKRQLQLALLFFFLTLVSGFICRWQEHSANQKRPLYYKKLSGTLYTIDRRTTQVQELMPLSTNKCIVRYGENEFEAVVLLPPDKRLACDRYYEFSGQLFPAQPAGMISRDNGISEEIPPYYGNAPFIAVQELSESGKKFSIFTIFFKLRDLAVERLICGIKDPDIAEMSARLFLGAGNGAPPEQKHNFIVSGTIHLFSVSGLHVTLFSAIILLLLYPLPFAWRYRITALFTLCYVLCTGASLPAIRAGTMVVVWALCRSFLLRVTAWDVMMAVWCAFALLDPAGVGTISAQYSFGITAALLLLSARFNDDKEAGKNIFAMMPAIHPFTVSRRKKLKWQKKLLMPPAAATTAFTAGCGISLFRQTLFTPGSIPANLLLIFITPLLFTAIIMKMTLGALCQTLDNFCAFCLESIFHLLNTVTGIMSECFAPMAIMQPPLWSIVLFYLLFFGALGLKSKSYRLICATGIMSLIFFLWIDYPQTRSGRIITISGAENSPPLIAVINPGGGCSIINVPNKAIGKLAGKILLQRGVHHASVSFSDGTIRTAGGIQVLAHDIDLTACKPAGTRKRPTDAFIKAVEKTYSYDPEIESDIKLHSAKSQELFCRMPNGTEIICRNTGFGRYVEIKTPDGKVYTNTLPWRKIPVMWECELE